MYQYSLQRLRFASRADCRHSLLYSMLQYPLTHYGLLLWSSDALLVWSALHRRMQTAPTLTPRRQSHVGNHLPRCTTSVPRAPAP
jgi:hypothetical protein